MSETTLRLKISHATSYSYDAPVAYGVQQLRLRPKSRHGQTVLNWKIEVEGGRHQASFVDEHANSVDLVTFDPGQTRFDVRCWGEVEVIDRHGIVGTHSGFAPLWLFQRWTDLTRPGPLSRALAKSVPEKDTELAQLHALSAHISRLLPYMTGRTDSAHTTEDVLKEGHAVCQDHAHVFLTTARLMGFPARYVSGYLMMNDRIDQDASHAWAEAHVAGLGWVGFDISNAISPDARYVRVATGLDYRDAAPISGVHHGGAGERLSVTLQVQQQ